MLENTDQKNSEYGHFLRTDHLNNNEWASSGHDYPFIVLNFYHCDLSDNTAEKENFQWNIVTVTRNNLNI